MTKPRNKKDAVGEDVPVPTASDWPEPQNVPADEGWAEAVTSSEETEPLPAGEVEEPTAEDWGTATPTGFAPVFIQTHGGTFKEDTAKYLVYGESGSGKTRFASTFPRPIFADIDKGMSSVDVTVDVAPIERLSQMEQLLQFLESGNHDYETVVIDTLNELQRIAMGATVENFAQVRRAYNDLPSQSDYGKMLHDMMEITRGFIALPMRVVLLAQVNTRQFEEDHLMPQLIGKSTAREITRKMDIVGCIRASSTTDENNRNVPEILFYDDLCVTKDRSFRLPQTMLKPSWARINKCFE